MSRAQTARLTNDATRRRSRGLPRARRHHPATPIRPARAADFPCLRSPWPFWSRHPPSSRSTCRGGGTAPLRSCPQGRHAGPEREPDACCPSYAAPTSSLRAGFREDLWMLQDRAGRVRGHRPGAGAQAPQQFAWRERIRAPNRLLSQMPLFFDVHLVARAGGAGGGGAAREPPTPPELLCVSFPAPASLAQPHRESRAPWSAANWGSQQVLPVPCLVPGAMPEFACGSHLRSRANAPNCGQASPRVSASTQPHQRPCPFPPASKCPPGNPGRSRFAGGRAETKLGLCCHTALLYLVTNKN